MQPGQAVLSQAPAGRLITKGSMASPILYPARHFRHMYHKCGAPFSLPFPKWAGAARGPPHFATYAAEGERNEVEGPPTGPALMLGREGGLSRIIAPRVSPGFFLFPERKEKKG